MRLNWRLFNGRFGISMTYLPQMTSNQRRSCPCPRLMPWRATCGAPVQLSWGLLWCATLLSRLVTPLSYHFLLLFGGQVGLSGDGHRNSKLILQSSMLVVNTKFSTPPHFHTSTSPAFGMARYSRLRLYINQGGWSHGQFLGFRGCFLGSPWSQWTNQPWFRRSRVGIPGTKLSRLFTASPGQATLGVAMFYPFCVSYSCLLHLLMLSLVISKS